MPTCPCGRPAALYGKHGPRLCAGCDADYDAILSAVLHEDFAITGAVAAEARRLVDASAPFVASAVPQ